MTYPRRPNYRPTASMIHEVRMIAQNFFANRTAQSIFPKGESFSLLCVACLDNRLNTKAVAINNGKSLCRVHL